MLFRSGTIAYLNYTHNPTADFEVRELEVAARSIGQPIKIVAVASESELEAAFASLKEQRVAALITAAGTFEFRWSKQLTSLATRHALPTVFASRELAIGGGLMSYSGSRSNAHRQAGIMCGRILKGDKPANLPVQLPTKYELVINLKTAKALGIDVPPMLLARADEVIE